MDGGVIAINWSGVFIIDKNEKHILDISFMELTGCSGKSIPKSTALYSFEVPPCGNNFEIK